MNTLPSSSAASPLLLVALTSALSACGAPSPAAPARCPVAAGPGLVHDADITRDEVWRAADGPHRVRGRVALRGAARLVVEPCAELRFAPGASLDVGQYQSNESPTLSVRGEAQRPVTMTREGGGAWSSLAVFAPGRAELAHVTLEGAGSDAFRERAAVYVAGDRRAPSAGQLRVESVTVRGAEGHGVVLVEAAAFVAGSSGLRVTASGAHPLVVGQHALDRLPDGDLTGNARDEVLVREDLANGFTGLQVDARVRRLSVPYHLGTDDGEPFRVGSSGQRGFATLTLDPGVELRFHPGVAMRVVSARREVALGAVRAMGTREQPVRFTSAAATQRAGDWPGLYFESPVADANELAFTEIAYAGGYCSCSLASCSPVSYYEGALVFDGAAPRRAFLRDSVVRDSAGHGVVRSWLDRPEVDFARGNTFARVAGCRQTAPMMSGETCPSAAWSCER